MKQAFLLAAVSVLAFGQAKYDGPRPEKPDLPYLRHANKLVPLEQGTANESRQKDATVYLIPGASASAKTPLTEPIFIVKKDRLDLDQMQLYKLSSKGGQRELVLPGRPKKNDPSKPVRISLDPLSGGLFKIEVQEPLENGEYCLSPSGTNTVFCFSVF